MSRIEVTRQEQGPYNPGTPGTRSLAQVPNADNFVGWLELNGWVQVESSTETCVMLESHSPEALLSLSKYGSKPVLRDGQKAWKVVDTGT